MQILLGVLIHLKILIFMFIHLETAILTGVITLMTLKTKYSCLNHEKQTYINRYNYSIGY